MAEFAISLSRVLASLRSCDALFVFGVVATVGIVPGAVLAQDPACYPSPWDAPPINVLTDADIEHVRLEMNVDPERPPANGRAVLTLRTTDVDADSVRLVTSGAPVTAVFSRDLDEILPFRHISGDTIVVDLSLLRDSLLVSRESISLELTVTSTAGVQFMDGFAWTIDPLLLGGAWYPWSGNPADRFTSELHVTVPSEGLVGASGRRLAERSTEEGKTTFLYASSEPHDARALLFAVGPFVAGGTDGVVDVQHPGSLDVAPQSIASAALKSFESKLAFSYPYQRLSIFVVPGAAPVVAGNGIVLLSDHTLGELGSANPRSATAEIALGVARQWFGGVISPAAWDDAWLPAALSSYLAALFIRDAYGDDSFEAHMRDLADDYFAEAHHYRRPLTWSAAEHPADLHDAHARAKTAWAAHTLRREVGVEPFWKVLSLLISWNQFDTVTTDDLGRAVEAVTGTRRDFIIDQWVHAVGHPELASSYSWERDTLFATIEQQQLGTDVPEVYDLELGIEAGTLAGSQRFDVRLDDLRKTFALPLRSEPRYVAIDPDARFLMDVAMEQSLSAWIAQLRNGSTAHVRLAATRAVARRRGDPAVLIGLRSALTQEANPRVKAAILRVIAELSDSDAAQRSILSAFEDTSSVVRTTSLEVLGAYSGSVPVERLALDAANNDPVNDVQAAAVELLGRIGSSEALPVAEAALITPSQNAVIRRAGLRVLGMHADGARDVALRAGTTYSQPEHPIVVRLEAVALLERLAPHSRRAENLLRGLLEAPDWQLRLAVLHALLRIGHEDAIRSYLENEPVSWLQTRIIHLLACE